MDRNTDPAETSAALLEAHIAESRMHLIRYILARVNDADLAEDILQGSLLKALRGAADLRDEERLVPWFRRIIDNAIADSYRERGRRRELIERYGPEWPTRTEPADDPALCLCFRALIPTLKEEYRRVIEAIELGGLNPDDVARDLGITLNNLNVRRHRARRQLRERLKEVCTACPPDSFIGCECLPEVDMSAADHRSGAGD